MLPEIKKWTTTTGQHKDGGLLGVLAITLHLSAEGSELRARVYTVQPPETALSPIIFLVQAESCVCSGHCLCLADTVATLVQTPVIWVVILQTYMCSLGKFMKCNRHESLNNPDLGVFWLILKI